VKALTDPGLYLGTKNIPDVCVLIDKATNCVSSETSYDWYDHFKKNCQLWPVIYKTKVDPKENKSRKSVPAPASASSSAPKGPTVRGMYKGPKTLIPDCSKLSN
jgi:hypothetical protein